MKPFLSPLREAEPGLYLKPEHLQPGSSYKIRGVAHLLSQSSPPPLGFCTVSAGNLGRALALACRDLGVPCRIFVPLDAPAAKKSKILALGAMLEVLPFPRIWAMLQTPLDLPGFVHPLSPLLLEGYGAIAAEILQEQPAVEAVVLPFGLGGLTLGVARELRRRGSRALVIAAELHNQAPLQRAYLSEAHQAAERHVHGATFVDAIGTPGILPGVLEEAHGLGIRSIPVTLDEARNSLLRLRNEQGYVVEGAAAVAHAAAIRFRAARARARVAVVLSGSNIAPAVHEAECALASSLAARDFRHPPL